MVHHALALCDGELTKQKVSFARCGGNPVGIATACVEKCRLCGPRGFLGQPDQLIFDLKRTQSFKLAKLEKLHGSSFDQPFWISKRRRVLESVRPCATSEA